MVRAILLASAATTIFKGLRLSIYSIHFASTIGIALSSAARPVPITSPYLVNKPRKLFICIIFIAYVKGLHKFPGHQPHLMSHLNKLTSPMLRASTRFHPN